jgi:hypothetical protein
MKAGWEVDGIVIETRELKSEKNASWRGYVTKIATIGLTLEVNITEPIFRTLAAGMPVSAAGRFEAAGDRVRFVATAIKPQGAK